MAKKVTGQIKDKAFELLKNNPDGLRYSELVKLISDNDEKLNTNTIHGSIWNLDSQFPNKIYKPSRQEAYLDWLNLKIPELVN